MIKREREKEKKSETKLQGARQLHYGVILLYWQRMWTFAEAPLKDSFQYLKRLLHEINSAGKKYNLENKNNFMKENGTVP
jgi:hypothetical protein